MAKLLTLLIILFLALRCFSQRFQDKYVPNDLTNHAYKINDSISILFFRGICQKKGSTIILKTTIIYPELVPQQIISREPLLRIHGNVLYNFSYRSYLDTPFAQSDLMQDLVQTNLNILYKDKYPLQVTVSNRNSNSPYFRNITDVNVQYNRRQLLENIKNNLREKVATIPDIKSLDNTEQNYLIHKQQIQQLQTWINSPARVQEIVEEKERNRNGTSLPDPAGVLSKNNRTSSGLKKEFGDPVGILERKGAFKNIWGPSKIVPLDSSKKGLDDSLKMNEQKLSVKNDSSYITKYNSKKLELAKLIENLKKEGEQVKEREKFIQDSVNKIKQQINNINNSSALYDFMNRNGISKDSLSKAQKILLSVDQIGLGRSFIDYSELTVKNIYLTGANIEVSPGNFYFAAAAGKVDYRYRDFILKNSSIPNQSLYLIRAGVGKKEGNRFVLTFYDGKKSVLNPASVNNSSPSQKVLGVSLEGRLAINANNFIIAEVAKSSYNNSTLDEGSSLLDKALNLKIHSNEAYSIKLFSQNPSTDTRFTGYYKKLGENFQSFNLYPINVNQASWMLRLNQNFWKRRLMVDASIRKNDFLSSIAVPTSYSTKTIFKSLQVTLRIPKYPFISVGYYPSSQLSLNDHNVLMESQYNTLNAIISHNYHIKRTAMNTNALFTKFYNTSSDTGFIYFNAVSYSINHSIFLSAFTTETGATIIKQKDLNLFTLEQSLSYRIKNSLMLSAGLKWNRFNNTQNLFGGSSAVSIYINKIGTLQVNYDKSYLPGYGQTLRAVDMGRATFYKVF